jgi:nucleotide-binding universal stress UspA family protein
MTQGGVNESLLVCVDGSNYTDPTLQYASWLGERVGIESIVVSHISDICHYQVPFVNEMGAGIGLQPCNGLFGEIHRQEQEKVEALKVHVDEIMQDGPFAERYHLVVEQGRPSELLDELHAGYKYVVFGKRGESFAEDRDHLGSNLDRFLKASEVPCLLASRAYQPIDAVGIIAYPGLEWAQMLDFVQTASSKPFKKILLIHAHGELSDSLAQASSVLKEGADEVELKGLDTDKDLLVAEAVNGSGMDLIMTGSRHSSGLFHWISTPVAKEILKRCRVPLLFFP